MRVLWICNIMLPVIAKELGIPFSNKEGWLSGLAGQLLRGEHSQIELGVCFPAAMPQGKEYFSGRLEGGKLSDLIGNSSLSQEFAHSANSERVGRRTTLSGLIGNSSLSQEFAHSANSERVGRRTTLFYYGFAEDTVHEEIYDEALERRLGAVIAEFEPDIIHCFGAEYGHTLAAVRAFAKPRRTLIGLQGICSAIAEHYLDGIPAETARRSTLRDRLRRDNLLQQQEKMRRRGEREEQALSLAGHITGRTRFDKNAAKRAAPQAKYHAMNETMRDVFYEGCWDYERCEKHSLFVSQGNYPVKGLHYVLQAMAILKKQYPDIRLYVAGDSIVRHGTLKEKIKLSSYGKYLLGLIREGGLEGQVSFLGQLDAGEMKERYLKAHVFVSPSTIENSPNSVGEAMLLGVPVVSSEVGGVPDMLDDGKEGLLYHAGNVSALAMAVTRIFEDAALARSLCAAARERARRTHDADANCRRLLEIYHEMYLCQ